MKIKYCFLVLLFVSFKCFAKDFYVSPKGKDTNPGTLSQPFATLEKAAGASLPFIGKEAVNVWLLEGTHYISKTLVLDGRYSASPGKGLTIQGLGSGLRMIH